MAKSCKVDGCERKHDSHGYCNLHATRWRRTGDPLTVRPHTVNSGCFVIGSTPANKGIPHSATTKEKLKVARSEQVMPSDVGTKISKALKGKKKSSEHVSKLSGPNHYRWKGGHSRNLSQREWRVLRAAVIERDDYKCKWCEATNVTLVAHHIIPFDEGGPDSMDNLIALCRSCHIRHHSAKPPMLP